MGHKSKVLSRLFDWLQFSTAAIALIVVLGASPYADATPIPTGVTPAADLIINFDLTGTTPSPPFTSGSFVLFFANVVAGTNGVIDFFGDLNGASFINQLYAGGIPTNSLTAIISSASPFLAGLADGTFSVGIRLTSGSGDLLSSSAQGCAGAAAPICTADIPGRIVTVPEPATLLLLACSLVALGVARRKIP
jgi:hypothetical protein